MPLFYEDSFGARVMSAIDAFGSADDELVEDPAALEAAQAEANGRPSKTSCHRVSPDWVPVYGPVHLTALADAGGFGPSLVTMPLDAEDVRYVWDPYPPESIPANTGPYSDLAPKAFTLLVAPEEARRARELIRENAPDVFLPDITDPNSSTPSAAAVPDPPHVSGAGVPAWIGFGALLLTVAAIYIAVMLLSHGGAAN